jgi:hypothetical protein
MREQRLSLLLAATIQIGRKALKFAALVAPDRCTDTGVPRSDLEYQ